MGELGAFLRSGRGPVNEREPSERIRDYREIFFVPPPEAVAQEGARCMDCGVPFCHAACPLGNHIPEFDDLTYTGHWAEAYAELSVTNDFPEFTGRVCPAPCEHGCVLAINDSPVAIKQVELAIAERAFEEGWARPRPPAKRSRKSVGVVGSGPAGLAAASALNHRGHSVAIFERDEEPGGLLRFGIPDFKLDKRVVDRRIDLLRAEGVAFKCGCEAGRDLTTAELENEFDAVVVAIGSRVPRELTLPGRGLAGVHFAMEYLYGCNRARRDDRDVVDFEQPHRLHAHDLDVVVIGGGDTAMDCVGNARREGARSVTLIDIYPEPETEAAAATPWPDAPKRLPTTYALEEGGQRLGGHGAERLLGEEGKVVAVRGSLVGSPPDFKPVPGSRFQLQADLVLIAVGFLHAEHHGLLADLELALDAGGNVQASGFASSRPGVFVAGDAHRGQSLVVSAIAEGRDCAEAVDDFLLDHPSTTAGR